MRIALMVTPENPVPPAGYGGGERVADVMVRQLVMREHEVDLYAAPGSTTPATKLIFPARPGMSQQWALVERLAEQHARKPYDVVIDRMAHHPAGIGWRACPVVSIMAGDPFKKYPHDEARNRVYVSRPFAEFCGCPDHPVLPNPVCPCPETVPLGDGGGKYAIFVGPVHPMKGLELAADACAKAGKRLVVFGPVRDMELATRLYERNNVILCGELGERSGGQTRHEILGRAAVFMHCAQCCDADPGAPKEAALCGTPIVACPNGGIRERVVPSVTGYFGRDADELARGIHYAEQIDRHEVRETMLHMVDPHEFGRRLVALLERAGTESW